MDARDAALYVDWTAPGDGGAAISHHDIRYRAGTSGPWTQTRVPSTATETVPTDMTISSLSNGTAYQVEVRACNTHGCGDWSPTATGTPSAMAPGELPGAPPGEVTVFVPCGATTTGGLAKPALTIAPVPQRRAALMWNGTTGADRYVVEVRRYGVQAWSSPVHGETVTAEGRNPCYTLKLDAIMTLAGGTTQGLAENDAYQFRVTARDTSNAGIVSDVVTLVDTPITRANGDSRDAGDENGPGLAEITWRPLHQQVAGMPSNGEYQLRHRVALGSHASPEWDPSKFGAFADPVTEASSPQEIGKLQLHEIYAIQLTYDSDNSGTPDVFAARDVYVWPSRSQATSGSRIAGFPVVRTLRDATFTYRICSETFWVEGETRRTAWLRLIRDAAARWQAAVTTDLVTFNEDTGPCITYGDIATQWARDVRAEVQRLMKGNPPITDLATLASHIETFVTRTREEQMRLWTPFRVRIATRNIQDKAYNEILLFDDESASLKTLIKYRVFDELASDLGSTKLCWYARGDTPDQALGCAVTQGFKGPFGETHFTTDIFFRRSAFVDDPLAVPGSDAKMNFCGFKNKPEGSKSAYTTAGHEIGHALGITSYAGADNSQWSLPGHPPYEVVDSIMSYNNQPRCAPYPLDLMAIHALYQTVD
ncbi:MAG: fibronectin type III domain-containing protein [Chloroflexi bacterium]|nr:fibronectin type III domain-containing protein [Chloroflexota bacterium]